MKKVNITLAFLFVISLISCKKNGFPPGGVHEKQFMLKKMTYQAQEYYFYFNKNRLLDSIVRFEAKNKSVYRVVRSNNRIDSVVNYERGWANTDFEYDAAGKITSFNNHAIPEIRPPEPVILTYQDGHLHSITTHNAYLPFLNTYDTVSFNDDNDITRWVTALPRSTELDIKHYTYDDRYNPLYLVDEPIAIFSEDGVLWEFLLSQHNSVTKYQELYDVTTNFENFYDSKGRLIKKRFFWRNSPTPDSLVFEYLK